MFRTILVAALVAVAIANEDWVKPAFCNENDCPIYTVLANENGYEMRQYEPAKWVSTVVTATTEEEADEQLSIAFNRLFQYIDGANDRNEIVDMTTPVATKVVPASAPGGETVFTRSFYIPYSKQTDPPQPTSADVFLQDAPAETVYVRSFTDYATIRDHIDNIQALATAVGDSSKYDTSYYYQNGYDSPYKWWDRHNEGWLVAVAEEKAPKKH